MRGRAHNGQMPAGMPMSGQMPPHNGQMPPHNGQMPPHNGQMPPHNGHMGQPQLSNGVPVSAQMMQGQMTNGMPVSGSISHQRMHNMYPSRTSSNGGVPHSQQLGQNPVRSHAGIPGDGVPPLRMPPHHAMSRGHSMGMRTPVSGVDGRMHPQQLDADMPPHHPNMVVPGAGSHMNPYGQHQGRAYLSC